jgi:hypothetical protein
MGTASGLANANLGFEQTASAGEGFLRPARKPREILKSGQKRVYIHIECLLERAGAAQADWLDSRAAQSALGLEGTYLVR